MAYSKLTKCGIGRKAEKVIALPPSFIPIVGTFRAFHKHFVDRQGTELFHNLHISWHWATKKNDKDQNQIRSMDTGAMKYSG